jgi:hypothetical protein
VLLRFAVLLAGRLHLWLVEAATRGGWCCISLRRWIGGPRVVCDCRNGHKCSRRALRSVAVVRWAARRPSATLARPDRHKRRAERCFTQEMDEDLVKNLRWACGLQALSPCRLVASRCSGCWAAHRPSAPLACRGHHDTRKHPYGSTRIDIDGNCCLRCTAWRCSSRGRGSTVRLARLLVVRSRTQMANRHAKISPGQYMRPRSIFAALLRVASLLGARYMALKQPAYP